MVRIIEDKGFGFIDVNGREYFFHRSFCDPGVFDQLDGNNRTVVEFEPYNTDKGLRAMHVTLGV